MKKQLLIAAVAATMSVSAMADISIAGSAKVNYTTTDFDGTAANTNKFSREMDLKITGKSGDTTIVMNFGDLDNVSDQPDLEDAYVSTSIGDVSIKTGTWDNGNNALRASARGDNKFSASTTMGGVKIAYDVTTELHLLS
jgi:ABC-type proline/glycine betaine transport system substrate-binding protein